MCGNGRAAARGVRRGFNLVELVVVLAVAVILTGLMFPAMSRVRENLHRIICSSNLRQLGYAVLTYAGEWNDDLPYTTLLDASNYQPQELMAVYVGDEPGDWDGLGLLYDQKYCTAPDVFYCPSHMGDHPLERYRDAWEHPTEERIYSNYHYAGHVRWDTDSKVRRKIDDAFLVIATDGLRTTRDFNHQVGMNVLSGDGSVVWRDDQGIVYASLPDEPIEDPATITETFSELWETIEALNR